MASKKTLRTKPARSKRAGTYNAAVQKTAAQLENETPPTELQSARAVHEYHLGVVTRTIDDAEGTVAAIRQATSSTHRRFLVNLALEAVLKVKQVTEEEGHILAMVRRAERRSVTP